jgi:hypothetical protein
MRAFQNAFEFVNNMSMRSENKLRMWNKFAGICIPKTQGTQTGCGHYFSILFSLIAMHIVVRLATISLSVSEWLRKR